MAILDINHLNFIVVMIFANSKISPPDKLPYMNFDSNYDLSKISDISSLVAVESIVTLIFLILKS